VDDEAAALIELVQDAPYRDIIFDLDGTLTLLDIPWTDWIDGVTAELPVPRGDTLRRLLVTPGAPWAAELNDCLAEGLIDCQRIIALSASVEGRRRGHTPNGPLLDALPLLKRLGCSLYLWTSNTRRTADAVLRELEISHLFDRVSVRDDVRMGKPAPEGWRLLCITTPLDRQLLVGDSHNDELAASAVGIDYYEIRFFHLGAAARPIAPPHLQHPYSPVRAVPQEDKEDIWNSDPSD
jgi:phosphoglycolate phosphatase-like HAD superfamily hydrolase